MSGMVKHASLIFASWLADMLEERLRAMEAQAAAAARAAAPSPEPQQHSAAAPPPYLPAPQFTFQPFQRDPPLYFDSRTASFRPDASPGSGASGGGDAGKTIKSIVQFLPAYSTSFGPEKIVGQVNN